MVSNAASK
ncbi:hypothetical protein AVEN_153553-1, partial [Araneus ventricosus]